MKGIRISAVGDIMPGDHYFTLGHGVASNEAKFGLENMLGSNIKKIFSESDVVFCNLEGVLSERSNKNISYEKAAFRGNKSLAVGLSKAGLKLVNIANNHILQHGNEAFRDTVDSLQAHNINIVGLRDASGKYTCKPVILELGGIRLGVLGYSAVTERYCEDNNCYSIYNEKRTMDDVAALRHDVDMLIVSVHCGEEGTERPDIKSKNIAKVLFDNGVDIILMHHTHVFQPVLQKGNNLLALNLGDFIFDLFWDKRLYTSAILEINISQSGDVSHNIVPVRFSRNYRVELQGEKNATSMIKKMKRLASSIVFDQDDRNTYAEAESQYWNEKWLQLKKLMFFIRNFFAGNTSLKYRFIASKLRKILM